MSKHHSEYDEYYKVSIPKSRKPRARELNEALVDLGGGKMKNSRDTKRRHSKREILDLLEEGQD